MTGATRTARWYRRRRLGKAIFRLELDEVAVECLLERAGLLQSEEADNHSVVERALQQLVETIMAD